MKAWRFFLGLRTSWMSREILVFSLFAGASGAVATCATAALWYPQLHPYVRPRRHRRGGPRARRHLLLVDDLHRYAPPLLERAAYLRALLRDHAFARHRRHRRARFAGCTCRARFRSAWPRSSLASLHTAIDLGAFHRQPGERRGAGASLGADREATAAARPRSPRVRIPRLRGRRIARAVSARDSASHRGDDRVRRLVGAPRSPSATAFSPPSTPPGCLEESPHEHRTTAAS